MHQNKLEEKYNSFTIVLLTRDRQDKLLKSINSLLYQEYPDDKIQIIVVNDGSIDGTQLLLEQIKGNLPDSRFKIITNTPAIGKAGSRNKGMQAADNDWISWLDDDDFYFPIYIEVMNQAANKYPDSKLFTCAGITISGNWSTSIRAPHLVKKGEVFVAGIVMSGGFLFNKSCLDDTGYLPVHGSPYEFGRMIREQHPEIVKLYGVRYDLGNPYGDDYAMFYKLTRYYEPIHLNRTLFGVMIRGEKQL